MKLPFLTTGHQQQCEICHPGPLHVSTGGPLAKVGSSAKFGAEVFKASILNLLWGDHLSKYVCLPSFVYQYSRNLCSITGGIHWQK